LIVTGAPQLLVGTALGTSAARRTLSQYVVMFGNGDPVAVRFCRLPMRIASMT
jgi:hypothetical protein